MTWIPCVSHPATTPSKDSDRSLRPRGRNYQLPVVTRKLHHQSFSPFPFQIGVITLSILVLSIASASVFCVLKLLLCLLLFFCVFIVLIRV